MPIPFRESATKCAASTDYLTLTDEDAKFEYSRKYNATGRK